MITVQEAEQLILSQVRDYGVEFVPFRQTLGRILAGDIICDRDMPAYDRISMDGIAIRYSAIERGITSFTVKATQAAGDAPIDIDSEDECIEIMTGGALSPTTDTIIPYEHIELKDGKVLIINTSVRKGQNIHFRASDKKKGDIAATAGSFIDASIINVAATVGQTLLAVKKQPRILIVSTGDELVDVNETPLPWQIRRSNNYTIQAVLQQKGLDADMMHLPDDSATIEQQIQEALTRYDVLLLSGGVSMGKYDHLPAVLDKLGVHKHFHKVRQRPGKPFWFGSHSSTLIFAFPGNPVSAFMCLHRYFLPWYSQCMGIAQRRQYAALAADFTFTPTLQYFLQVTTSMNEQAQVVATPLPGNGSGDLANLVESDAFLELPIDKTEFKAGEVYRLWSFKNL
jgi:molybdopterin molybdotransferase